MRDQRVVWKGKQQGRLERAMAEELQLEMEKDVHQLESVQEEQEEQEEQLH